VFGGLQKCCMGVFGDVLVCASFEIDVHVGCGFAMCLRDERVGPGPCAYRNIRTRVLLSRVWQVSICDLIG
jgi:hypothetical protein